MKKLLLAALLLVVSLGSTGCVGSWFESSCTKALPALTAMNAYFDNAQTAINRAQLYINTMQNPEVRAKAQAALDGVVAALQLAQIAQEQAVAACTAPDAASIFAGVIKAWAVLSPFLAKQGGPGAGSAVPAPLVVSKYGSAVQ